MKQMIIISIGIWFSLRSAIAGDTCCYGRSCPAAIFATTTSTTLGVDWTAGQEVTVGSYLEGLLSISVAECCPDGGWVIVQYNSETTVDKMCRCWDTSVWYTKSIWHTQSSCIKSTFTGCAPTSSPTAEKCPDFAPYEVAGNSYTDTGTAYCSIGENFNIPPVISSEQRCDIENTICLKGAEAAWDGTFSRTANDVAYAWPKYSRNGDVNKFIQRGLGSNSYWVGNNDGTVEWSTDAALCGSSPYDYNIVGINCELSVAGKITEFPLATITAGVCVPPTANPTTSPTTKSEISADDTTNVSTVLNKWMWCLIITIFYVFF